MPNITLIREHLFEAIGKPYTDHEFDELCFEFGVEVDDVCTEIIEFTGTGVKEEHVVYVIAIPANRYDLLCLEGFARAIRVFTGLENSPRFTKLPAANPTKQRMVVSRSVNSIRPFIVCAVLRNISFDPKRYKSFIDLQDKLHQNICRKRTYVAIGTHDLDTIQGPFKYEARSPELIKFVPLTEENNKIYDAKELLTFYREDPSVKHLKSYTDIIFDSPVYPVVYDSEEVVLSLPPIINGKHSRIQLHTKNVFIECTGTDLTKANIVLDTVVTMFAEYCAEPFTVEGVDVTYEDSDLQYSSPALSHRHCEAKLSDINGIIGVNLHPEEVCKLCDKLQLGPAEYIPLAGTIRVYVPPTRSDILHSVDIIEDVAIAYGYNNIPLAIPNTLTVGAPLPINLFTDLLRAEVSRAGYVEMLTHGLCSRAENFTYLRRELGPAVSLQNPANLEYEVIRTTLFPGALKTLAFNRSISHKEGVKLFEISDVVVPSDSEVGASNVRKMVALSSGHSAGFEVIHGLVDHMMTMAQIQPEEKYAKNSLTADEFADRRRVSREGLVYFIRAGQDPLFFPGMSAELVLRHAPAPQDVIGETREVVVGVFGVLHPEVLEKFQISYPCSGVELNIELIM